MGVNSWSGLAIACVLLGTTSRTSPSSNSVQTPSQTSHTPQTPPPQPPPPPKSGTSSTRASAARLTLLSRPDPAERARRCELRAQQTPSHPHHLCPRQSQPAALAPAKCDIQRVGWERRGLSRRRGSWWRGCPSCSSESAALCESLRAVLAGARTSMRHVRDVVCVCVCVCVCV